MLLKVSMGIVKVLEYFFQGLEWKPAKAPNNTPPENSGDKPGVPGSNPPIEGTLPNNPKKPEEEDKDKDPKKDKDGNDPNKKTLGDKINDFKKSIGLPEKEKAWNAMIAKNNEINAKNAAYEASSLERARQKSQNTRANNKAKNEEAKDLGYKNARQMNNSMAKDMGYKNAKEMNKAIQEEAKQKIANEKSTIIYPDKIVQDKIEPPKITLPEIKKIDVIPVQKIGNQVKPVIIDKKIDQKELEMAKTFKANGLNFSLDKDGKLYMALIKGETNLNNATKGFGAFEKEGNYNNLKEAAKNSNALTKGGLIGYDKPIDITKFQYQLAKEVVEKMYPEVKDMIDYYTKKNQVEVKAREEAIQKQINNLLGKGTNTEFKEIKGTLAKEGLNKNLASIDDLRAIMDKRADFREVLNKDFEKTFDQVCCKVVSANNTLVALGLNVDLEKSLQGFVDNKNGCRVGQSTNGMEKVLNAMIEANGINDKVVELTSYYKDQKDTTNSNLLSNLKEGDVALITDTNMPHTNYQLYYNDNFYQVNSTNYLNGFIKDPTTVHIVTVVNKDIPDEYLYK